MLEISIVGLAAIYLAARQVGSKYSYPKVHWVFEAAHFLAGFFLAMFFSNFLFHSWEIIVAVLTVGALWEIWELIAWNIPSLRKRFIKEGTITIPDTLLDLFLDVLGAMAFVILL